LQTRIITEATLRLQSAFAGVKSPYSDMVKTRQSKSHEQNESFVSGELHCRMTTLLLPTSASPGFATDALEAGSKIIQRILSSAGSDHSKARCMADADEDLVLQSQNGNPLAFETLIRNHQTMIHALTFRMTGSPADAEDLAQVTFIRAYDQIGSYRRNAKFSTWLYSIAVHACLNWRRNEARRFQAYANCAEEMLGQNSESEISPPENELAQQAQAALMKLPAKQRAAIVLTIYDGLNHAEAATVLRCSETTVSWRVFTAKRKLKRWLVANGERQ
jgi:RNA polymerase sigma-70 factor (ECF subfamily)